MATDPVLAARSALGNATRTRDLDAIREAKIALADAKAQRAEDERNAVLASVGVPPLPRCP